MGRFRFYMCKWTGQRTGSEEETVGHKGKADGQPAYTRETELGCVFTQTIWDKEGYAIRNPDSTTYTGVIETAEEFGKRTYREAWNLEKPGTVAGDARKRSHRRRSRMDLESGGCALSSPCEDRRFLSRAAALVGLDSHTIPQ